MKLAEFLAKYLDSFNGGSVYGVTGDVGDLEESIQAGIEAFAKAESKRVVITNERGRQYELFGETR